MHCDVDFVICQVKQGDGWGGRYDKGVERCSAVLGMLIRVMALGEQRIVAGPAFEAQPKAAEGPVHCDLGNPIPWPEHRPAHRRVDCTTFGLGDHGRFVWGEGDPTSRLMFVLDNPGAREDKEGASFVCGTRRTLRKAME